MTPVFLFLVLATWLLPTALSESNDSVLANFDAEFPFLKHSFLTSRNLEICNKSRVNVNEDSAIDDYGAYLSKKAAEIVNSTAGGGSILLADGVYKVKSAVIIPSSVCLFGSSMDRTILRVVENANNAAPMRGVIRSVNTTRVTLKNFTLDCNMEMQKDTDEDEHFAKFGVFCEACNYTFMSNVRVKGALGYGFDPHGSKEAMGHHVAIEDCIADSCVKDGFKVSRMIHASVINSIALNSGRHGVHVTKGSQIVSLEGNKAIDSGYRQQSVGCGIMVDEDDSKWPIWVRLRKNRIHNAYHAGICLTRTMYVEIEHTAITNNVNDDAFCVNTVKAEKYTMFGNFCDAKSSKKYGRDGGEVPRKRCIGISTDDACCPKACGVCGGSGCSSRIPNINCCASHIEDNGKKCMWSSAPCVM